MPECRMAVLGLCSGDMEPGAAGVGKSCLCSRFVHPGVDDWRAIGSDHSHWLDQADFQEPEIGGDHFLYFGVGRRDFYLMRERGKSDGNGLSVHLVEHTLFVDSFTGKAFPGAESYERRATSGLLKSKGAHKPPYTCRTHLGEGAEDKSQEKAAVFPRGFSASRGKDAGVQAYLYVLDPMGDERSRREQWRMWEKCWSNLPASKRDGSVAIVLTKCDAFSARRDAPPLDKTFNVVEHFAGAPEAGKFRDDASRIAVRCGKASVAVFFASAETGVGVDLPFTYLAHRALALRGQPLGPVAWAAATQLQRELQQATLRAGDACVLANVTRHTHTWARCMPELLVFSTMDVCRTVNGLDECKALFRSRLLALMTAHVQEELGPVAAADGAEYTVVSRRPRSESFRERLLQLMQEHPDFSSFVEGQDSSQGGKSKHLRKGIRQLLAKSRQRSVYRSRMLPPLPSYEARPPLRRRVSDESAAGGGGGGGDDDDDDHLEAIAVWCSHIAGSGAERLDTSDDLRWSDRQLEEAADIFQSSSLDSPCLSPRPCRKRFFLSCDSGAYLVPLENQDDASPPADVVGACPGELFGSAPCDGVGPINYEPCWPEDDEAGVADPRHGELAGRYTSLPRPDSRSSVLRPYAEFKEGGVEAGDCHDYVPMDISAASAGDAADDDVGISPYAQFRAQQSVLATRSPSRLPGAPRRSLRTPGTPPRSLLTAAPGGGQARSPHTLPRTWKPNEQHSSQPVSPAAGRQDAPISSASNSGSSGPDPRQAHGSPVQSTFLRTVYPQQAPHISPARTRLPGASPTPLLRVARGTGQPP